LQRIDEYITKAVPIVRLQRQEWKVLEVNADQPIPKVFADLEAKLELSVVKDSNKK
jgi:adenylate kinase family enzyme